MIGDDMPVLVMFFICTTLLALSLIKHTNLAGRYLNIVTAFGIVYAIGLIGTWAVPAASQQAASEQFETFSIILLTALMFVAAALFAAQELQLTRNTKQQPALAYLQNKVKAPEDLYFPVNSLTFRQHTLPSVDESYSPFDPSAKVIRVGSEINDFTAGVFDTACREVYKSDVERVCIVLHSAGGDVHAATSMRDQVRALAKTKDVYIYVAGKCRSAANTILLAVPVEKRIAAPSSDFMVHTASNTEGPGHDSRVDLINAQLISDQSSGTMVDKTALEQLYASRKACFFNAEQALERGFIGAIR